MEETRDALQNKLHEVRLEREHVSFSLDQTTRKTQVELQDIKQSNQQELETVQSLIATHTTSMELAAREGSEHKALSLRNLVNELMDQREQLNLDCMATKPWMLDDCGRAFIRSG